MKTYCVYVFVDEQETPFYVGVTGNIKSRMRQHEWETRKGNCLPKYAKMRLMLGNSRDIMRFVRIVADNIGSPEEAFAKEIEIIAGLRKFGLKLKNLTDGGEGNINPSPEQIERWRLAHTGTRRSAESRRRMSEARKGIVFSEEHRLNLSIARKKRHTTNETREKMRVAMKGQRNIKVFRAIDPQGGVYITNQGLSKFCEDHGLHASLLHKVLSGERSHHRGWRLEKIEG